MFLKEFAIQRYGPLHDSGKRVLGNFNLFYGPNEDGKTLTIDALLRIMLGKGVRMFEAVQRVAEFPEGYMVIADSTDNEYKLPEAGTISSLCSLSASEFGNIFVIRDSDLTIKSESEFYSSLTNRLTGLRTDEIRKIKNSLYELGQITETGEYKNVAPLKLKDRIKKAAGLIEKIEALLADLRVEGFGRFEEELAELVDEREKVIITLNHYQDAEKRELFEKGEKALQGLKASLAEAKKLQHYNQTDYNNWQHAQSNLEFLLAEQRQLQEQLEKNRTELQPVKNKIKESKAVFKELEDLYHRASEKLEPLQAEYDQLSVIAAKQNTIAGSPFTSGATVLSALVFLVALVGFLFRPYWWLFLPLTLSLAIIAHYSWRQIHLIRTKSRLASVETKICSLAAGISLPSDNVDQVRSAVNSLKLELNQKSEHYHEAEKEYEWLTKEAGRLKTELDRKQRQLKESESNINQYRQKSAVESVDQYRDRMNRLQDVSSDIQKQKSILKSHFGSTAGSESDHQDLDVWEIKVNEIRSYADRATDLVYDQTVVSGLDEHLSELDQKKMDLEKRLKERSDELRDIEKELNDLLYAEKESRLPCQTIVDLEAVLDKLKTWQAKQKDKKNCASAAIEIFEEMEEEEKEKVTSLFGANNRVSSIFESITDGYYSEVVFESRENQIKVVRKDGKELVADQLSGGAYDQLYFAIRLTLGEKLLEGEPGFLILDDPFIKADPKRLKKQLDMLAEISKTGWQIIYFSAKGEVQEALHDRIKEGQVMEFTITR